ncbi:alkaline phosphatase family protein [Alienimonas californiensis]|uniref:Type I phosphodiesterase / nucleotide pyrophosphatase n=1 Tax=Alienimonas californiensis TaxID=2527989 RepID=A0A517P9U7_9PLAN|nr:nucleotide pyrophosphatase/phosphodiesterase family protein [Alienimonas californiensis]QDT16156.1 Type I phosphodiesterase / nucleotide pyrophosphatase [Alienimonas californiensis]
MSDGTNPGNAAGRSIGKRCVVLSIPGLRERDLAGMPRLLALMESGVTVPLEPEFPAVTCPVHAALTTGVGPSEHGVIANGFYWREGSEVPERSRPGTVELWTAWDAAVQAPRVWDWLRDADPALTSAVWFPMPAKGANAETICTPAPIHNPDGSESLWCYTKPTELYGELKEELGHFPLMNFWGPLSAVKSSQWIADSAVLAQKSHPTRFAFVYLPHLDYAAQKFGPDSAEHERAVGELDAVIGSLANGLEEAFAGDPCTWIVAGEYAITPVSGPVYPNRVLREAGLFTPIEKDGQEHFDPSATQAFAVCDHQFAHVYLRDPSNEADVNYAREALGTTAGISQVYIGEHRAEIGMDHPRAGDLVLTSEPDRWFAYYWWTDDAKAPPFARTVDIHRKPGYDPVEMFLKPGTRETPLDATLVKGSHGLTRATGGGEGTDTVLLISDPELRPAGGPATHAEIPDLVLRSLTQVD